ncbi:hypothetical protein BJ166DRAFT_610520 [Pestalotiopsis sp. NC0098]|nr:hypothetical protein BJ166DRAFT_610520 [Pestalotiopsis sp. NC0098]
MLIFKSLASIAIWTLARAAAETVFFPPEFHSGSVEIETTSIDGNLDGFKMKTSANCTSFDYWWFYLVSTSDRSAVNVVFFNAGDIGNSQPLAVELSRVFANGTTYLNQILADGVTISNGPEGFAGTNLAEPDVQYNVTFDSPELGAHGNIHLRSRAPAHYPCDLNVAGVSEMHLPRFFWANAVPDADVTVDLTTNGTAVQFKGIGYHDKNWGDKTVLQSPKYWDWGHARVGSYSVVWYDLLDFDDNEYHRSYIARDGQVQVLSCDDSAAVTRPLGSNATWPNSGGLTSISGVSTNFALPDGNTLTVNVTINDITYDKTVYTRAVGSAVAQLSGESGITYEGKAFIDEFTYGLLYG